MAAIRRITTKKVLTKSFPKLEKIRAIPIPFQEPSNLISANVYVLGDCPLTLIDTGPNIPGSIEFIQDHLSACGLDINDVNRILITHGHVDHFGLASTLRQMLSHPVDCFVHPEDKWRLCTKTFQEELWSGELDNFFAMAGTPDEEVKKMRNYFSYLKQLGSPLDDALAIEDGDEITGDGYRIRVIHTPGHTAGSCCLYETERKILFSGDHVIKHITPNPLVEVKRDSLRDRDYQSLKKYIESLQKIAGLEIDAVFPGHGEYIEDLSTIISSYILHHRERMELIWNALRKKMRPIYDLIDDVFFYVPENDTFLAVSEILVHLELLINEGRAELSNEGPPALFSVL